MNKRKARRELSFRRAMPVTEVVGFANDRYTCPRCPRCLLTMDREYMHFCDRCGQKLDWTAFPRATLVRLVNGEKNTL